MGLFSWAVKYCLTLFTSSGTIYEKMQHKYAFYIDAQSIQEILNELSRYMIARIRLHTHHTHHHAHLLSPQGVT